MDNFSVDRYGTPIRKGDYVKAQGEIGQISKIYNTRRTRRIIVKFPDDKKEYAFECGEVIKVSLKEKKR